MPLIDWRARSHMIADDVRIILEAEGHRDTTLHACREWTREFIRRYIPDWEPGIDMHPEQARLIGGAFERHVAKARRQLRRHA